MSNGLKDFLFIFLAWQFLKLLQFGLLRKVVILYIYTDFFIDLTEQSFTLNMRDMNANDSPMRKQSSISIFTIRGYTDFIPVHISFFC